MLKPETGNKIPATTFKVAKAAFPKGNRIMRLRDELGAVYSDEDFASLFSSTGQPALAPWRLALVTVFQFLENLSDRQAADAVRSRLDWKCALGLELEDPGFDLRVTVQALGWRKALEGQLRYLPLQDDIASTAFWYQQEPHAPFPKLLELNGLEVV